MFLQNIEDAEEALSEVDEWSEDNLSLNSWSAQAQDEPPTQLIPFGNDWTLPWEEKGSMASYTCEDSIYEEENENNWWYFTATRGIGEEEEDEDQILFLLQEIGRFFSE